jgi:hypothetical protein
LFLGLRFFPPFFFFTWWFPLFFRVKHYSENIVTKLDLHTCNDIPQERVQQMKRTREMNAAKPWWASPSALVMRTQLSFPRKKFFALGRPGMRWPFLEISFYIASSFFGSAYIQSLPKTYQKILTRKAAEATMQKKEKRKKQKT